MSFIWSIVDTRSFKPCQGESIDFEDNNDGSHDVINGLSTLVKNKHKPLTGLRERIGATRALNGRKIVQVLELSVGVALIAVGVLSLFGFLPIPPVAAFAIIGGGGLLAADVVVGMIINLVRNRDQRLFREIIKALGEEEDINSARVSYSGWFGKEQFLYFSTRREGSPATGSVSAKEASETPKPHVISGLPGAGADANSDESDSDLSNY